MARIRTIKPDAFLSESLSTVPRGTRWTFAGLWTCADDKGRARDDQRLIKAALYPLDDDITLADVGHDLDLLWRIGAICRYVVGSRSYLHMPKWTLHQRINRPTESKIPECPECEDGMSGHVLHMEDSLNAHGGLTEDSPWERKGREGNREGEGNGESEIAEAIPDAPTSGIAVANEREDVRRLCEHLAARIEANGAKRPDIGKTWHDSARLLIDKDGRAEADIHAAIEWASNDEFWRANVLSMPKLREKYETLRLQAMRKGPGSRPVANKAEERMRANLSVVEQLRAEEQQQATHLRAIEGNR